MINPVYRRGIDGGDEERVEGRKRGPEVFGDLTPGGALGGRHDESIPCVILSEAAVVVTS